MPNDLTREYMTSQSHYIEKTPPDEDGVPAVPSIWVLPPTADRTQLDPRKSKELRME